MKQPRTGILRFGPSQLAQLRKLARTRGESVSVVIASIVVGFLEREQMRHEPQQLALPLPNELRRLAQIADHAAARFRSARRKLNPARLIAAEPTRVM